MNWEKPQLIEINMSAEIGAYQEDFDEREDAPPFVASDAHADGATEQTA
jgi:hypothetical protein